MTTKAPPVCAVYVYVHRVDNYDHGDHGWKCACGAESQRNNHPSREAAVSDWGTHEAGAK
jgi:hypothetical protein